MKLLDRIRMSILVNSMMYMINKMERLHKRIVRTRKDLLTLCSNYIDTKEIIEPEVSCISCGNVYFINSIELYFTKRGDHKWKCPNCSKKQHI